ncbi:unnamed protein product [Echinostoma caproni]|uniref:PHD domain-containing protein n=1 Tax=Echinostoma caproni TaxID=27848 RepID=A0A183AL88_9TREM|nr:unnamed protein product [Echinostoma caproni]
MGPRTKTLQCNGCDHWLHLGCNTVSPKVYDLLCSFKSDFLKVIYDKCAVLFNSVAPRRVAMRTSNVDSPVIPIPNEPSLPEVTSLTDVQRPISSLNYADVVRSQRPVMTRSKRPRPSDTSEVPSQPEP